jgi:hypothetical protein
MQEAPFILPFHADDLRLLPLDEVSVQLRVSRAFVQLCIDAGCRTRANLLSAAELLHWLFENYARVRELAGFPEFASVDGISAEARTRLKMANALFTLLEYGASRASDFQQKRQLRIIRAQIERGLEAR